MTTQKRIGLALGGGAARGLAHIPLLEVLDDLGVVPAVIAGSSMGALVGAAYASGCPGREIRDHALRLLSNRMDMVRHVFGTKNFKPQSLLSLHGLHSLHFEGRTVAELMLPSSVPALVEATKIPLKIVTTDFTDMVEHVIERGSLHEAVGASIAIPGLIGGPIIDGHIHVDGGITNPVPFDRVRANVDLVVAIDVTGRSRPSSVSRPSNIEVAVGSLFIMFQQLAELRRALNPPDIYITPAVDTFGSMEFFKAKEIFLAAEPAKETLKRALDLHLS